MCILERKYNIASNGPILPLKSSAATTEAFENIRNMFVTLEKPLVLCDRF